MTDSWTRFSKFIPLISIVLLAFMASGCDSDDGKDGADGNADVVGDLAVAQADDVAEHHRGPELLTEACECRLDVVGELLHRQRLVGRRPSREHPIGVVGKRRLRPTTALAGLVEEHVRHDAGQPSLK